MIDLFVAVWVLMFLSGLVIFIHGLPAMLAVGLIPAHKKGIAKALELADIKPNEKFYDLGCGDGRVLVEAVKKYDCWGVGYELMFPYFLLAKIRAKLSEKEEKIDLRLKNIFQSDIENADIIFCFLSPELMQKMSKYLKTKKLKNGARVVSYAFRINDMEPAQKINQSEENWNIYLYNF